MLCLLCPVGSMNGFKSCAAVVSVLLRIKCSQLLCRRMLAGNFNLTNLKWCEKKIAASQLCENPQQDDYWLNHRCSEEFVVASNRHTGSWNSSWRRKCQTCYSLNMAVIKHIPGQCLLEDINSYYDSPNHTVKSVWTRDCCRTQAWLISHQGGRRGGDFWCFLTHKQLWWS